MEWMIETLNKIEILKVLGVFLILPRLTSHLLSSPAQPKPLYENLSALLI